MLVLENSYKEEPIPELAEYYQEFKSDRMSELQEIQGFLAEKKFTPIAKMAHKWKGISEPYGFGMLGQLALSLETAAKNESLDECSCLFKKIDEYLLKK